MKTLKFKHNDKNYTVKGEWNKNIFTAQAYLGKNVASAPFEVKKEKIKDGILAEDSALEEATMEAAKNEVISGEEEEEA